MAKIAGRMTDFSRSEVLSLLASAKPAFRTKGLTFLLRKRTGDIGRILIIIPRRVGNSPERHQLRRRLKALFYELRLWERSVNCVVRTYPGATTLTFDALKTALLAAYRDVPECTPDASSSSSLP